MPRRTLRGEVVSTRMDKTIVISVQTTKAHRVYKKLIRTNKKYKARCDTSVSMGDLVEIQEIRPLSKTVTWEVVKNLTNKEE